MVLPKNKYYSFFHKNPQYSSMRNINSNIFLPHNPPSSQGLKVPHHINIQDISNPMPYTSSNTTAKEEVIS
jgi:hypothetical protein